LGKEIPRPPSLPGTTGPDRDARLEEIQKSSLDLQEKYATQARKEFDHAGYKHNDLAGFESHYNHKLKKCFILYQSSQHQRNLPSVNERNHLITAKCRRLHTAFDG
jgi:hypothetical protein